MKPSEFEMSVPRLRCFVTIVESGSIGEAARRLGTSAPTVSKALMRLEQTMGVKLLHRSTHALSLTDKGEALLEPAREALRAMSRLHDAATHADGGGETGPVRITVPAAFARHVLAPRASAFVKRFPDIQLNVKATNEIVDLADEAIDVAVRGGSLTRVPGHIQQPWFSFPWVVCAAPCYLRDRAIPRHPDELDGHDQIGFRNLRTGQVQGWSFRTSHGGTSTRYTPKPKLAFDDGDAAWEAVVQGAGIGRAPLWLATGALKSGAVVEVLKEYRDTDVRISILRRERRLTPARVHAVVSFLAENPPDLSPYL